MKTRLGLLLLALAFTGCALEADDPVTTITASPASTTLPTVSTSPPTTRPTTATSTTTSVFPPPAAECPPVLVVGERSTIIGPDCSTYAVEIDGTIQAADGLVLMDDLAGGLLYQTGPSAILWLETGAAGPTALVEAAPTETVWLEDVVRVVDEVEVWFTRWTGGDSDIPEDHVQTLERMVVDGEHPTVVGQVGGWESGSIVTVGGEVIALQNWAEGFYMFSINDLELDRLPQPWAPYDEPADVGCEDCPVNLVVADDGSKVAFLSPEPGETTIVPILLVVDIESGEELARIDVPGFDWPTGSQGDGPEAGFIDILGDVVLINGWNGERSVPAIWTDLRADEPSWEELEFRGDARFLRSDVRVGLLD